MIDGCAQCGGVIEMTASEGGVTEGNFTERYECINCGATGRISGDAEHPARQWNRHGPVFDSWE